MQNGILTLDQLDQLITDYMEFDEFVVDVETLGPYRGDPHRNDVFWISLAGPGRADAIPCGHPLGERVIRDLNDEFYRIDPATGKHQEHRINEETGRLKWVTVPEPFTDPPKQLWISDVIPMLRPLFFSKRRIIGQNIKFDIESLAKYFGAVPPGPYADTLVAAKLVDENHHSYKLGDMIKRQFHFEYEKIGKAGPENFPYSEAHRYSYLDAKYTWLLYQELVLQLKEQKVSRIFRLEMDLLPAIIDMECTGVGVDEDALAALGEEFLHEMARLKVSIDRAAGKEINLNANRQIAELVYDTLGHKCTVFTKTEERSTARDTLEAFAHKDPTIERLLEHATLRKLQSTFIEGLAKSIHDGRIHPSFNQVGAVSGRVTCREPNIQQIPVRSERGKRVRSVFVAGPGNVLIVADLSQIELRVLAHFTQDTQLLRAYRRDMDLHSVLAERVFGKDFTPTDRSYAKNGNFSCLYGAGPETLVRRYGFPTVKLARQVLSGFYRTYPAVQPWKERTIDAARARRTKHSPAYVRTILGRKRRLPGLTSFDNDLRSASQRQAVSVRISGTAADLFKIAMINCHDLLLAQAWEGHILMQVHDELVVEVPEDHAEEGLSLVKAAMEDIVNPFTGEAILSLPIVADAKIVRRWSDAK